MVNFRLRSRSYLYVYVPKFVLLNVNMFVYVPLRARTYVRMFSYVLVCIFTYLYISPPSVGGME